MPCSIVARQIPLTAFGLSGPWSRLGPSTSRNGKRLARLSFPICVQNLPWRTDAWRSPTDLRSTRTSGTHSRVSPCGRPSGISVVEIADVVDLARGSESLAALRLVEGGQRCQAESADPRLLRVLAVALRVRVVDLLLALLAQYTLEAGPEGLDDPQKPVCGN